MYPAKKLVSLLSVSYHQDPVEGEVKDQLLARLEKEKQKKLKVIKNKYRSKIFLSFLAAFFVVGGLSLTNQNIRSYASQLPVLGKLVQLVTGEQLTTKDNQVNIKVPAIKSSAPLAESLNQTYLKDGQAAYQQAVAQLGETKDGKLAVTGDYQKLVDDQQFLVIKRTQTTTQASSNETHLYTNIAKKANLVLSLPMLFKNQDYLPILTQEIQRQISEQMAQDNNKHYWTEAEVADGSVEPFELMTPEQDFYLNEKHQLVIAYPEYKIAPGYMGTPEFVIPHNVIKDLLVDPDFLN